MAGWPGVAGALATLVSTGGWIALAAAAGAQDWTPVPVAQDANLFMPGSQHGSVSLPGAANCANCHAGYDPVAEPFHNWQGSMMAQATRDPLWLACMAVAEQDSIWALGNPNAGDLCIRCHTPPGWLRGRSEPVNGSALVAADGDFEGVSCTSCHQLVDPFTALAQADVPAETDPALVAAAAATRAQDVVQLGALQLFDGSPFYDPTAELPVNHGPPGTTELTRYIEAGAGQMFIDTVVSRRRGPRDDVVPKNHTHLYSRFHKSRAACRTCHDVSNPALANVVLGAGTSERQSAASYFHVERTSSEFELSAYAAAGGAAVDGPLGELGVAAAGDCQDCHMPRVPGKLAKQNTVAARSDVAKHALNGGNAWMSRILASTDAGGAVHDPYNVAILDGSKYPGATLELSGLQGASPALLDGEARATGMLQRAASLQLVADGPGHARLRVVNHTGHKLISGFPEGRRMWLNVQWLNGDGSVASEVNPYQPLVTSIDGLGNEQYVGGGDLTVTDEQLVYEAKMSSTLTGEDKTFHFVLATDRHKDNRIPPKGFRIGDAAERLVQPRWHGGDAPDYFTAEEYAGGFDEVTIGKPAGTAGWTATLYYQTTSKDYVVFLRDEIRGEAATLPDDPPPSGVTPVYRIQSDPFFAPLKGWGDAIWDLWLHNNGAAPVAMARAISPPGGAAVVHTAEATVVRFETIAGRHYQVEARDDLQGAPWRPVGGVVDGDGSVAEVPDPLAAGLQRCFYRVACWLE